MNLMPIVDFGMIQDDSENWVGAPVFKSGLGLLFSIQRKGWDTHVMLFLLGASVTDVSLPCLLHFLFISLLFSSLRK